MCNVGFNEVEAVTLDGSIPSLDLVLYASSGRANPLKFKMEYGSGVVNNVVVKKDGLSLVAFLIDPPFNSRYDLLEFRTHFIGISINNQGLTEDQPFSRRLPVTCQGRTRYFGRRFLARVSPEPATFRSHWYRIFALDAVIVVAVAQLNQQNRSLGTRVNSPVQKPMMPSTMFKQTLL